MITIILFGLSGYLVHFLGSWAEYCKTVKPTNPLAYVQQDLPGWLSATAGSVLVVALTADILHTLTVAVSANLLAALLGYVGSSALGKLASVLGLATGDR